MFRPDFTQEIGSSVSGSKKCRRPACASHENVVIVAPCSLIVNTQRPLADTLALMFPWCAEWEQDLTSLFREYVNRKLQNQALDYDDLLLYWHALMHEGELAADIATRLPEHSLMLTDRSATALA